MRKIHLLFLLLVGFTVSAQFGNEWIDYSRQYWKFAISTDGVYRITYESLLAGGFPVGSVQPNDVRFYSRGAEVRVRAHGADVTLVSGPVSLSLEDPSIHLVRVTSAQEMLEACDRVFNDVDICVMSAAVADYRPKHVASSKVKKTEGEWAIEMERTTDILKALGERKRANQLLVGFALETDNELENAKGKLERKNLDFIVLNSLNNEGAGFAFDTNKITLIERSGNITNFELKSKAEVAADIVDKLIALCGRN